MKIEVDRRGILRAEHRLEIPLPAGAVWWQMRNWRRFLTLDPLHREIVPLGEQRGCAEFRIPHRLLGLGPDRVGRMLCWEEGHGYAISDLSARGVGVGFPHICTYRVDPKGPRASVVLLGVKGKWTARFVPRWVVRLWVGWVLLATGARVMEEMTAHRAWLRRKAIAGSWRA